MCICVVSTRFSVLFVQKLVQHCVFFLIVCFFFLFMNVVVPPSANLTSFILFFFYAVRKVFWTKNDLFYLLIVGDNTQPHLKVSCCLNTKMIIGNRILTCCNLLSLIWMFCNFTWFIGIFWEDFIRVHWYPIRPCWERAIFERDCNIWCHLRSFWLILAIERLSSFNVCEIDVTYLAYSFLHFTLVM